MHPLQRRVRTEAANDTTRQRLPQSQSGAALLPSAPPETDRSPCHTLVLLLAS
jgi:hypothetical protein